LLYSTTDQYSKWKPGKVDNFRMCKLNQLVGIYTMKKQADKAKTYQISLKTLEIIEIIDIEKPV